MRYHEYDKEICRKIKRIRIENGLSQIAVSKATGISQNAIAQWENAKRVPNANADAYALCAFTLATCYLEGNGVKRDKKQAAELLYTAASNGNNEAAAFIKSKKGAKLFKE